MRERIDESKNIQTTPPPPTRTYCKCSRPFPYCNPNCRTPRHWKFTQHHPTTPRKKRNDTGETREKMSTPLPTNTYSVGWSGGAMVLGKLPVPGRPTIRITVGQGPTALAVSAGGGCLDIFTLTYPFFPLSPSLWETARYRLKYSLKGPLNPKQPTNQTQREGER